MSNSHDNSVYCLPHAVELLTHKRSQVKHCSLLYAFSEVLYSFLLNPNVLVFKGKSFFSSITHIYVMSMWDDPICHVYRVFGNYRIKQQEQQLSRWKQAKKFLKSMLLSCLVFLLSVQVCVFKMKIHKSTMKQDIFIKFILKFLCYHSDMVTELQNDIIIHFQWQL